MSHHIAILAIQLGIIVFLAKLFGNLAAKCHIPSVMGELLAGIVFGPFCLGGLGLPLAGFENGLFPKCDGVIGIPLDPTLYSIATLGSIVLLFLSGLETDVRTFFKYSVVGTVVGIGGILCSFLCGAAVGVFALGWDFMDPRCLFLGILCTATSVGISARILSERHAMDSPEGVTIMAAAVIDDVLGIVCLAIVIGIANVELNGGSLDWGSIFWITCRSFAIWLGVTAVGLVCARKIAGFLKLFKSSIAFSVLAFGLALILAGLFEQAGLAMIIGAFVMGLSLSKTDIAFKIRSTLTPIYNFFVPVFFVAMGMLVDVRVLKDPQVLGIGLLFSFMAILGKVLGCSLPALALNFNWLGSLRIGVGMVPRCEVVLIIAGIAATTMMKNPMLKEKEHTTEVTQLSAAPEVNPNNAQFQEQVPIFDSRLFGIAIIMPLVTALTAPPLLGAALSIKGKGVKKEVKDRDTMTTRFDFRTEAIASFALNEILELFKHDGFATSGFSKGIRVIQFRKDKISFSLEITNGTAFCFSSSLEDVPLIKTAVYESLVELHKSLSELKQLAQPDTFKTQIYGDTRNTVKASSSAKSSHSISLANVLTPDNVIVNLKANNKTDAFKELLSIIDAQNHLNNVSKCYQDLLEREAIISTYQDNGIAMPHARTDGTSIFTSAIGIKQSGFDYDAGQEHRTQIVILSLCPNDEPGPYLQFISLVAQVLTDDSKRLAILTAKTAEDAIKAFTEA